MLPTSRYSKALADHAVAFISQLKHTKGEWAGQPFELFPWQEQLVRDIFGIVDRQTNKRQFRDIYCEIPKKQGKSELAAAIALYLLCADDEFGAEIYGCAKDRGQACVVFNVARDMMLLNPTLRKLCTYNETLKRIVYKPTRSFYTAVSGEPGNKQGLNIHGCIFDELVAQDDRRLFDIMTKGAGAARRQPMNFIITTAGNDRTSICYEVHQKAIDIEDGRRIDATFYPLVKAAPEEADWTDPEVWEKCNPSLGLTTLMSDMVVACENAKVNAAEEVKFRRDHLCQWLNSETRWLPMDRYALGAEPFDPKMLFGWECYGGLDLASTDDIAAFVLVFPPQRGHDCYYVLPHFWIPQETVLRRVKKDNVLYDKWVREGHLEATKGDIIYYDFIEKKLEELADEYNIKSVAFDEWGAVQMAQNLERQDFEMIKMRQSMRALSPPAKEVERTVREGKLRHGNHPVLKWMFENVTLESDAAGNIKPSKSKSHEKIDGVIATVMAFDLAICKDMNRSAYDDHGLLTISENGLEEYDSKIGMWKPHVRKKKKWEQPQPAIAYNGGGTPDYLKKTGEKGPGAPQPSESPKPLQPQPPFKAYTGDVVEPPKPAIAYNTGIPDYLKKRGDRIDVVDN